MGGCGLEPGAPEVIRHRHWLGGEKTMLQVSEDGKGTSLSLSRFTVHYLHPGFCSWLPLVGLCQPGGEGGT